jgi:hypothetical protein
MGQYFEQKHLLIFRLLIIFEYVRRRIEIELFLASPEMQQQVLDFVAFLLAKLPQQGNESDSRAKFIREFGCEKGGYYMAPDFDEPLEEFKEYMS